MIRTPLALALLALPLSALARAQDEAATISWYDVRGLTAASSPGRTGVAMELPILLAIHLHEPGDYDVPLPDDARVSVDACVDALERAVSADPSAEVEMLDVFGGRVRLVGNAQAHRIAARTLAALEALAEDAAVVDVLRIPRDRLPEDVGAVLEPERVARLLAELGDLPTLSEAVPLGRRATLGAADVTSFLADYDVEVAQGSMAPDPVVAVVRSGLELGVRLDRAADGRRLVLRAWGRDTILPDELRRHPQPGFADAVIELPSAAVGMFAGSAILPSGGAVLLQHGDGAVLVRVTGEGAAAAFPSETVTLGEHLLGAMRADPVALSHAVPSGGLDRRDDELALATAPWAEGSVDAADFVDDVLGLQRPARTLIPFGSRALHVGADDDRSALRTALDEYAAASPMHTFELEVVHALLEPAAAAAMRAAGDYAPLLSAPGATRTRGAVLEGDSMLLVGGEEAAYLQDYDVQIAAGSTICDPIVQSLFDGLALWASPVGPTADGGLRAWVDVQLQRTGESLRELPVVSYHPGAGDGNQTQPRASGTFELDLSVEFPATRRVASRGLVTLSPGAWRLVTAQPLEGTGRTLVVAARARARR